MEFNKNLFFYILGFVFLFFFIFIIFIILSDSDSDSFLYSDNLNSSDLVLSLEDILVSGNVSNCIYLSDSNLSDSCVLLLSDCLDDSCYFNKARFSLNESLCFEISDESLSSSCSLDVKLNTLLEQSILEDDIDICLDFEDLSNQNYCRDNFYLAQRFNNNDLSYCNLIFSEEMQNVCFS